MKNLWKYLRWRAALRDVKALRKKRDVLHNINLNLVPKIFEAERDYKIWYKANRSELIPPSYQIRWEKEAREQWGILNARQAATKGEFSSVLLDLQKAEKRLEKYA